MDLTDADFGSSRLRRAEFAGSLLIGVDFTGAPLDLNRPDSTFLNHRGLCYASTPAPAAALRT